MKWIVSKEAAKKRKEKGDKRKLKKYWRLIYPPNYADEMVGNEDTGADRGKTEN
jgi:hypothetical protein